MEHSVDLERLMDIEAALAFTDSLVFALTHKDRSAQRIAQSAAKTMNLPWKPAARSFRFND